MRMGCVPVVGGQRRETADLQERHGANLTHRESSGELRPLGSMATVHVRHSGTVEGRRCGGTLDHRHGW
jgi:hypothetical protein